MKSPKPIILYDPVDVLLCIEKANMKHMEIGRWKKNGTGSYSLTLTDDAFVTLQYTSNTASEDPKDPKVPERDPKVPERDPKVYASLTISDDGFELTNTYNPCDCPSSSKEDHTTWLMSCVDELITDVDDMKRHNRRIMKHSRQYECDIATSGLLCR
jgi:hypothetical protein